MWINRDDIIRRCMFYILLQLHMWVMWVNVDYVDKILKVISGILNSNCSLFFRTPRFFSIFRENFTVINYLYYNSHGNSIFLETKTILCCWELISTFFIEMNFKVTSIKLCTPPSLSPMPNKRWLLDTF